MKQLLLSKDVEQDHQEDGELRFLISKDSQLRMTV